MRARGTHEPRRHPPQPAARAWGRARAASASTAHRDPARARPARRRRGDRDAASTSCRSAGRACGRSSTATSCARRGWTTGSSRASSTWSTCPATGAHAGEPARSDRYDALVVGAGPPGSPRRVRLAEAGARVLVLAKGVGRDAPRRRGTIDVLGYAPERVESPARGARPRSSPTTPTTRTRAPARRRSARRSSGSRDAHGRRRTATPAASSATCCCPARSARRSPSALVPETMAAGDLRDDAPIVVVGFRALKDFHAALLADNLQRAGSPRARSCSTSTSSRVDANTLGLARALRPPAFRAALAASSRGPAEGRRARRLPGRARRCATPARRLERAQERLGRPVFEIPTLPPSVPGLRVYRMLRERAARAGGRVDPRVARSSAPSPTATASRVRATAAARDVEHRADWLVLATGGFAAGAITLDSDWRARETVLDLPLAACPGRASRASCPTTSTSSRWRAWAWRSTPACARSDPDGARVHENVLVAGATLGGAVPWKENSGEGISLTTGYRAAARSWRIGRPSSEDGRMSAVPEDDVLLGLMRGSLDHCVKCTICETHCPFSNVTPLFPGPKYVGPQAERFRTGEAVTPDASVDYCSSCGICTQVCPQGVHIAEINTPRQGAARARREGVPLRNQLIARPDAAGRARHAGRAARELDAGATSRCGCSREKLLGHPPRRARCRSSPGATFQRWAQAPRRARRRREGGRLLPRLRHELLRARARRDDRRDARAQRLPGDGPQAGLLRAAAAVQRHLRRRARAYVRRASSAHLAPHAREGDDDRRRRRRAARSCSSARRARSSGSTTTPTLRVVSEHTYDICEFLLELHDRGELRTDFQPVDDDRPVPRALPAAGARHRQARARPASRSSRAARDRDTTRLLRRRRHLRAEEGEVRQISMDVGARPVRRRSSAADPDLAACDSETCRWHIEKATGVASVHPVELLHRAYGL